MKTKIIKECPKCKSRHNFSIERSIDGFTTCNKCNFKNKHNFFDKKLIEEDNNTMHNINNHNSTTFKNIKRIGYLNNKILTEREEVAFSKLSIINEELSNFLLMEESGFNLLEEAKIEDVSSDADIIEPDKPKPKEPKEEQQPEQPEQPEEPAIDEIDPEQLLMKELDATQEKVIQFNIYGSITDLKKNLSFAIDNISNNKITNKDLIEKLNYYQDLLEVISELIFVLNPNTLYTLYGTTNLEITKLFKEYLNNKKINEEKK